MVKQEITVENTTNCVESSLSHPICWAIIAELTAIGAQYIAISATIFSGEKPSNIARLRKISGTINSLALSVTIKSFVFEDTDEKSRSAPSKNIGNTPPNFDRSTTALSIKMGKLIPVTNINIPDKNAIIN